MSFSKNKSVFIQPVKLTSIISKGSLSKQVEKEDKIKFMGSTRLTENGHENGLCAA